MNAFKKRLMKKKNIYFLGIAILLSGCAESIVDTDGKKGDENLNSQSTTTFIGGTEKTRTSLNMTYPGGTQVNYFWEPGDKIWTADGISGTAQITATAPTAKFKLPMGYTSSTITVYYPGKNATSYNGVVIPKDQNQDGGNSTKSLGDNGDCGTATAQKRADGSYQFNLDHKATVLCFLPYTHNNYKENYVPRVTSITVTSDDNIAGSYTLTPSGLTGSGTEKSIKLSLDYDAAALNTNTPNQALSAAYMVIAPGTHTLKVEYTLEAKGNYYNDNVKGVVTKTINTHTYLPNMVYPIEVDLTLKDFSDKKDQFYQWDAKYNYWYNAATGTQYDNIPVKAGDSRNNYPDIYTNPSDERVNSLSTTAAVNSCKDCPTFAAMTWYAFAGDPYYDNKNPWFYNGYMCVGGAWFKKWNHITATDANGNTKSTTVPYNNYPQEQDSYDSPSTITMKYGQPAGALWDYKNGELASSEYFYLPCLGLINYGDYSLSDEGFYWTSTPYRTDEDHANCFNFMTGQIQFNHSTLPFKNIGQQIWTMK